MTIYDQDYVSEQGIQQEYQPGVKDPVAVDQEASASTMTEDPLVKDTTEQPVEAEQPVAHESDKEMNFRALREELAQMKEDRDRLRDDFEGLRRNQVQRQPEPPRKRAIDEINSDDLVTGAQFKQAMAEREAEYQLMLGELQIKASNPDYDEVTSKYGIPLIEKDPDLAQGFLNAPAGNRASYLYKLGKMAMQADRQPEPAQREAPKPSQNAQRIVDNARKPGTLSNSVGGAGSLSQLDYIASLSDKDFIAMVEKNLAEV